MAYILLRYPLLVWCLAASLVAAAQPPPIKLGAVEAQDFDRARYSGTEQASAVVLCDYGYTRIEGSHDGFKVAFERVTRILVLTKAGYDYGTVQIPLYRHNAREDELLGLRGFTYNLVNGRVEKQKLAPDAIFREKISDHHFQRKFTLPAVREGSIIEYAYTLKSWRLAELPAWQFQYKGVPVVWSEYRTVIPGFYIYKEFSRGYFPYAVRTQQEVPYSTTYSASHRDDRGLAENNSQMHRLDSKALSSRWVMQNVPAFRPEAYMTTPGDYLAGLKFELHTTQFDASRPQAVTSTWDKITTELLQHERFGGLIERRDLAGEFTNASPLTDAARALPKRYPTPAERAAAALALVRGALRYNGEEWRYASQPSLARLVERGQGNAADLNLLLVHTLRDAGLEAHPVLLSTRSNGRIQTDLPALAQFNYVVAHVTLPDQPDGLLLDATDPLMPPGVLPERCLGGQGRLLGPAGRWLALSPTQRFQHVVNAQLALSAQGQLRGKVRQEFGGYAGLHERARFQALGEKGYFAEVQRQHPDWQATQSSVQHHADPTVPLLVDVDLTVPVSVAPGQPLYLPILRLLITTLNPFPHETRAYPVDFGVGHEYTTTVQLTLPAGYQVPDLPGRVLLALPGNAGRYAFEATRQGNIVYITSRLSLPKTQYQPSEYAALRELFVRALAKHAEPLVLTRTP